VARELVSRGAANANGGVCACDDNDFTLYSSVTKRQIDLSRVAMRALTGPSSPRPHSERLVALQMAARREFAQKAPGS
jgi:hypothetical protein